MRRNKLPPKIMLSPGEIGRLGEIARFTRLLRKLLGIHNLRAMNVLVLFELLKKLFPRLKLRIVPDSELDADARAYPNLWLVKIRQGVANGLERGERGSRFTFMHELGHVLLQHSGRPFRNRSSKQYTFVEQEAHTFAAEFLAPTEYAQECKSAEDICRIFNLSSLAAEIRFDEIYLDKRSKQFGNRLPGPKNPNESVSLENHAAIICASVAETISGIEMLPGISLEPIKNNLFSTSTLTSKAAQLLVDGYESVRGTSHPNKLISAMSVAAAILAVKPIRETGLPNKTNNEILKINQICALKAALACLGVNRKTSDMILLESNDYAAALSFHGNYLTSFIDSNEKAIVTSSTILHFKSFSAYHEYNGENDVSVTEISQMEVIIRILEQIQNCACAA